MKIKKVIKKIKNVVGKNKVTTIGNNTVLVLSNKDKKILVNKISGFVLFGPPTESKSIKNIIKEIKNIVKKNKIIKTKDLTVLVLSNKDLNKHIWLEKAYSSSNYDSGSNYDSSSNYDSGSNSEKYYDSSPDSKTDYDKHQEYLSKIRECPWHKEWYED